MEKILLVDCCSEGGGVTLSLNENTSMKNGKTIFRGKFQEAEAVNKNKRSYPYEVLDENVSKLQEAIKDRRLIGELDHPCITHKDFRVLAVDGWKSFSEIREGDYVWSRVNGEMIRSRVNGIIDKPYDGPAYRVKGRSIDTTFTPDHKFVLVDRNGQEAYVRMSEIHANRTKFGHHSIPKTATWNDHSDDNFVVIKGVDGVKGQKQYADNLQFEKIKFASFLGIYLAEGSLSQKGNRVFIAQKNDEGRALIRSMLDKLHPNLDWAEREQGFELSDARLHSYLSPLGNKYNKYVPQEIKNWSSEALTELLYWFAVGDGRIQKLQDGSAQNAKKSDGRDFTRMNMFSVSKQLISDLHECLLKTGKCGTISVIKTKHDYQFAGRNIRSENKKPLYQLNVSKSKNIHMDTRFLKTVEIHHTGRIYCLMTEHGNFYMEEKGKSFWTGNCDSIVHFANASHLVTRLWWEGSTLMGEGEILNTPSGKVLKALLEDGVKVGISSRGVGNGKVNEDGVLVIGEGYKLITFDAVADPSTFDAFQEKVVTSRKTESRETKEFIKNATVKNEVSRIDTTVIKETLIACLGGIVNSKVE